MKSVSRRVKNGTGTQLILTAGFFLIEERFVKNLSLRVLGSWYQAQSTKNQAPADHGSRISFGRGRFTGLDSG